MFLIPWLVGRVITAFLVLIIAVILAYLASRCEVNPKKDRLSICSNFFSLGRRAEEDQTRRRYLRDGRRRFDRNKRTYETISFSRQSRWRCHWNGTSDAEFRQSSKRRTWRFESLQPNHVVCGFGLFRVLRRYFNRPSALLVIKSISLQSSGFTTGSSWAATTPRCITRTATTPGTGGVATQTVAGTAINDFSRFGTFTVSHLEAMDNIKYWN